MNLNHTETIVSAVDELNTGDVHGYVTALYAVEVEGITIVHFADGLVVERWNRLDDMALLTQLGALPVSAPA